MNMNLLNLAIILSSTVASSSAASTNSPSIRDDRIEYKIYPVNDRQLKNVFAGFNDNRDANKFKTKCDAISGTLSNKMSTALAALNLESRGIDEIINEDKFLDYNYKSKIVPLGRNVIETAKKEWELRSQILGFFKKSNMMRLSDVDGSIKTLTDMREKTKTIFESSCENKSLTDCYYRNMAIFDRVIEPVKKGTIAQEMFGTLAGVNTADWFKPDWKPMIKMIADSESRFAIAPIKKDLNFISILNLNGQDYSAAIETLIKNLVAVESTIPASGTALIADFDLRKSVVRAITASSRKIPLDADVVARRVKAFERIAEGVVRAHQSRIQLDASDVDTAFKAYFMSVQMFVERGFEDAEITKFATLAVPSGITLTTLAAIVDAPAAPAAPAAPVAPVIPEPAAPLAEKQNKLVIEVKRADSTSSNASTDSSSSVDSAEKNPMPAAEDKSKGKWFGLF